MIHVITSNNHPSNPQQPIQQPYVKRTSKLLSCKSVSHVPILSFIPHVTLGEITRFTARKAMWLLALNRKLETAQDSAEKTSCRQISSNLRESNPDVSDESNPS